MISRDEMMELLLAACPSFEPQWREFLEEWEDEPPPLPLYLPLGDLAVHLIRLAERPESAELKQTFAVIEKLHREGDRYVREAATIGVLEQLQNTNHHRTTSPEIFLQLLHPESKRWWDKLERFWGGDPGALAE